jgi:hypothetical protein
MTNHSTLFTNLMKFVLGSGLKFHDIRTAATFGWALVGLLISETIHLNHWALFRPGATKVASKERQFSRWLHNDKIRPMLLYPQLVQHALQDWKGKELFLALDTTVVAYRFVIVRLALVYRGRAIPLGWVVCASRSAMVPLAWYQRMLAQVAASLPTDSRVVLLADRGFAVVKLMRIARQLGWHFRIRVKSNVWVHRATRGKQKIKALMPPPHQPDPYPAVTSSYPSPVDFCFPPTTTLATPAFPNFVHHHFYRLWWWNVYHFPTVIDAALA